MTTRVHVLSSGDVDALIALHYTLRGRPVDLASASTLPVDLSAALDLGISALKSVVVPSSAPPAAKAAKGRANYKSRYETTGSHFPSSSAPLTAHSCHSARIKERDHQYHIRDPMG